MSASPEPIPHWVQNGFKDTVHYLFEETGTPRNIIKHPRTLYPKPQTKRPNSEPSTPELTNQQPPDAKRCNYPVFRLQTGGGPSQRTSRRRRLGFSEVELWDSGLRVHGS